MSEYQSHGYDALWSWFGMSYSSWLTMPRAMMHSMPDEWQARMAKLCEEWDETWSYGEASPLKDLGTPMVQQHKGNKFAKWPNFVLNYRHPDVATIEACKQQ